MHNQCFIEVADFKNLARYVCAFRENSLRVYLHDLNGCMVFSAELALANTLLSFYTPTTKKGRYVSYELKGGKEHCDVVNSTKTISHYAPIIHLESLPSKIKIKTENLEDQFTPIKTGSLGSLVRIAFSSDPDVPDLTLFLFEHKKKWIIGQISSIDFDDPVYCFNYVTLDSEPTKPFLRYSSQDGKEPKFTDKFEHGYSYLAVIKLKHSYSIFGLN